MISYYCYFGDILVGENLKKIIFGKIKVIPYFEKEFKQYDVSGDCVKILIRYFVDGLVTKYENISDKSFFYLRKEKVFTVNFRLEAPIYDLKETYDYFVATTFEGINFAFKEREKQHFALPDKETFNNKVTVLLQEVFSTNIVN